MHLWTCRWCGKKYETGGYSYGSYCSGKCKAAAEASKGSSSGGGSSPSSGSSKLNVNGIKLAIPFIVIILVIGLIGVAVNGVRNAFSDTKIKVVSASCDTEGKFVSIIKDALSGETVTLIEGDEFTSYSTQARDAVKKRTGKYGTYKDTVYHVILPDNVKVYLWFQTENNTMAYIYKIKE